MKYRVCYKVVCKCYVEVEADYIEDAMDIAEEDAWNLDNICESIDKTGEDFNVEVIGAEQVRPLLAEVYGVDEFGNVIYVEDDEE